MQLLPFLVLLLMFSVFEPAVAQERQVDPRIIGGLEAECRRRGGSYSYPYCTLPSDNAVTPASDFVRLFVKWECMRDIAVGIVYSRPGEQARFGGWWNFPAIRGEQGNYLVLNNQQVRHRRGQMLAVHVKTLSGPRQVSLGGNVRFKVKWDGGDEELGFKQLDGAGMPAHKPVSVDMENGRAWIDLDENERGTYTISIGCKFYEDYPRRR